MNSENESRPYEPILQQKLDMMDEIISRWQSTTHEQHVAIMRSFIEYERLEAKLADARVTHAGSARSFLEEGNAS
jgi:hypothetical protein